MGWILFEDCFPRREAIGSLAGDCFGGTEKGVLKAPCWGGACLEIGAREVSGFEETVAGGTGVDKADRLIVGIDEETAWNGLLRLFIFVTGFSLPSVFFNEKGVVTGGVGTDA